MDQVSLNLASDQRPKKKRLLLLDANTGKCAVRVKVLGKAGFDVDYASDTIAARTLWRAHSYNLVLIDLRHDAENAATFCTEIKADNPRQIIAFLVGKPAYLSSCPIPELDSDPAAPSGWGEKAAMLLTRDCSPAQVRGGFLEATLRMSAKRSLKDSRPTKTSSQSFGEAVRRAENGDRTAS